METSKIKVRIDALDMLQKKSNLSDTALAGKMGISRSTLWRIRLPETSKEHCHPGEDFIASALKAFPGIKFEQLFFLDDMCRDVHIKGQEVS